MRIDFRCTGHGGVIKLIHNGVEIGEITGGIQYVEQICPEAYLEWRAIK